MRADSEKTKSIYIDSITKFIKGAVVGLIIILPGMSGGTMILLLGLYEDLMRDMAKFK